MFFTFVHSTGLFSFFRFLFQSGSCLVEIRYAGTYQSKECLRFFDYCRYTKKIPPTLKGCNASLPTFLFFHNLQPLLKKEKSLLFSHSVFSTLSWINGRSCFCDGHSKWRWKFQSPIQAAVVVFAILKCISIFCAWQFHSYAYLVM